MVHRGSCFLCPHHIHGKLPRNVVVHDLPPNSNSSPPNTNYIFNYLIFSMHQIFFFWETSTLSSGGAEWESEIDFVSRILIFMRFLGKPARFTNHMTISLVSAKSELQCGPGLSELSQLPIALSKCIPPFYHHSSLSWTHQTLCLPRFSLEYIRHGDHLIFQFFKSGLKTKSCNSSWDVLCQRGALCSSITTTTIILVGLDNKLINHSPWIFVKDYEKSGARMPLCMWISKLWDCSSSVPHSYVQWVCCLPPLPQIPFYSGHTSILQLVNKEDYGFKSMFPWKQPIINAIWRGGMQLPKLSGKKWSELAALWKPLLTVFASFPSRWPTSFYLSKHLAPIC